MKIFTYLKTHVVLASSLAIIVVVVMIIGGRVAARKNSTTTVSGGLRQVSLVSASSFRSDVSTVSANGTVESVAQADLRSQVSAPISYINASIGSSILAGQVILELKNADIRARLDQAKAALVLAQGGYQTGAVSLTSARVKAVDEFRNAYTAIDQAIRGQVDPFLFSASAGTQPLSARISDFKLIDTLHSSRDELSTIIDGLKAKLDGLGVGSSDTDLSIALAQAKSALGTATVFLDSVSSALNTASKDASVVDAATLGAWKTIVSAAKGSLSGETSAITGADTTLKNSLSSQDTSANANISAAQAGVASLEAELAKTIITSPISGKVAALPLHVGELASPGTLLATVVGGGGLQVKAFASSEDLSRITKGASALIDNSVTGTVVAVAPSINATNKKVEVTVAVAPKDSASLVIGQSVSVSIHTTATAEAAGMASSTDTSLSYFLPIQDVKIIPGEATIFTIDGNSKVVKHTVILGTVDGDFVEVKSGITDDMQLVTPVYELEEGQVVDVR